MMPTVMDRKSQVIGKKEKLSPTQNLLSKVVFAQTGVEKANLISIASSSSRFTQESNVVLHTVPLKLRVRTDMSKAAGAHAVQPPKISLIKLHQGQKFTPARQLLCRKIDATYNWRRD